MQQRTKQRTAGPIASPVLSVEDAAAYVGCGRTFMYEMLRGGVIPSLTVGRLRKVRKIDLDTYLDSRVTRRGA